MNASVFLNSDYIGDICLAVSKMHGAEMTLKYCEGNRRKAERVFGWNRNMTETGLGEKRTGIVCIGGQAFGSGRTLWEEREPEAAETLRRLAEEHSQQDPTFGSTIAYTRLTPKAAVTFLKEKGFTCEQIPSLSSMPDILNRMGYHLRNILKSKPLKKSKKQMQYLRISEKKISSQEITGMSCG